MKQLLLRVPEDLHRRIAARAARERRSVNALANEILEHAADAGGPEPTRQQRGVARAKELGIYRPVTRPEGPVPSHEEVREALRGLGAEVMRQLEEDRGRLDRLP